MTVRDRWRAKTNYAPKRFTGFAPISFAMVAEVGRLTAGKATQILYVILTAALGQIVEQSEAFNERMTELRTADLAELAGCDERTVQRELGDLALRKVIIWEQPKKGVNSCTPLFRSWASLKDYKIGPVLEPDVESDDEPIPDDPAHNGTTTQVTKKPVFVGAGKRSKAIKVDCGVASLQFESSVDADCSAVVQGGVLLVTLAAKWNPETGVSGLQNQKGLHTNMRQGCRILPGELGENGEQGERRSKGEGGRNKGESVSVSHPRAGELCKLFDAILLKSCGKSLSGDHVALLRACEELRDTPHDELVTKAVERAARPIRRPLDVATICREIHHNWKRSKGLPAKDRLPTREEVDAQVEIDRAARLKRQAELRRGVA